MPSIKTWMLGFALYFLLMCTETLSKDGDTVVNSTIDCMTAKKECENDIQCAYAMLKVFKNMACSRSLGYDINSEHITGPADKVCPTQCGILIYNLTSLAKGKKLQSCECVNRDSICLTLKARLAKCMDTVIHGVRNDTKPGCSTVRVQCSRDKDCNSAQQYFLRKCSQLISGVECSRECKKAQKVLLSSPLGRGLDECECDGFEEPHCRGIRAHQKALCFGIRVTKSVTPKYRPTQNVGGARSSSENTRLSLIALVTIELAIVLNRHFL